MADVAADTGAVPATLPKTGSLYDIALAAAVLSASRKNPWHRLEKTVLLGEWPWTDASAP